MSPEQASWPDGVDALATALFLLGILGVTLMGYALMVLDFRAYLRSLRRQLVRVMPWNTSLPGWARQQTPRCLSVFGLAVPCSEEDLMRAYRHEVKRLHPDRGGDKKRFLLLQSRFEEARQFIRNEVGR